MLVLTVEVDQPCGDLAKCGGGRKRAVDERAAPTALRGDLPPDDQVLPAGLLEHRFDGSLLLAGADQVGRGAPAHEQADGPDKNGLAGAGLAGEHVEAGLELQVEPFDYGQVADGEEAEHRTRSAILSDV